MPHTDSQIMQEFFDFFLKALNTIPWKKNQNISDILAFGFF